MSAIVIDGKAAAKKIREEAAARCAALKDKGINAALAVILVGDDAASLSYVAGKRRALSEAGMSDRSILLPSATTEDELLSVIRGLNADKSVHGILVQLPLPSHIDSGRVILMIDPKKDVDGFHPINVGNMCLGRKSPLPCTPHGIMKLLEIAKVKTDGAHAVIIGRSNIVGKPLAMMLMSRGSNATVTVCHTHTRDIASITRQADILIAAAGRAGTVTAEMVKEGAAVIDVGVNRVKDESKKSGYRLAGDVDFEAVKEKASVITPVPGGVGPMTIAMLMMNTIEAAEAQAIG